MFHLSMAQLALLLLVVGHLIAKETQPYLSNRIAITKYILHAIASPTVSL
ncbi:MAG: hypothetical protein ACYTXE_25580 [Nostoc sp.]